MTCEQATQLIEAIQNMSIVNNITCGNGCGCGGGDPLREWRVPDGWEDSQPLEPIADDNTPTTEPSGDLCDAGHSAHADIRDRLDRYWELVIEESPYAELAQDIENWVLGNPHVNWIWEIISFITVGTYANMKQDALDFWDSIKDDFVCQVVASASGDVLRAWVLDEIRNNATTWSSGYYIEILLSGTTFNPIYDGSYTPAPEFIGSDCSNCVALPDVPTGYQFVPMLSTELVINDVNAGTQTYDDVANLFSYEALTGEWNGSYCAVDWDAIKARVGGSNVVGAVVHFVSEDATDTFNTLNPFPVVGGVSLAYQGKAGTNFCAYKGDLYLSDPNYASWVDAFDDSATYGNFPITGDSTANDWQCTSHFSPRSCVYKIWVMIQN